MSDRTKIEWADATVNAVNGCSLASPGCTNCYAMKLAGTRMKNHPTRAGLTQDSKAGPVWTGKVRLHEPALLQPLRWQKPRRIFWNAHGDLFHPHVPDAWIDRVFAVAALTPQHTHMILTKRSGRMREYFRESTGWRARIAMLLHDMKPSPAWNGNVHQGWQDLHGRPDGLPNVWLGVSVEDQQRADERIPDLLATPAAVRFISAEPLLGPVDLRWIAEPDEDKDGVIDALIGCNWIDGSAMGRGEEFKPARPGHQDRVMRRWVCSSEADVLANRKVDWVIVGGESGPGARPMHPDWARSLRDQCAAAGVAYFHKQNGEWLHESELGWWPYGDEAIDRCHREFDFYRVGKRAAGRLLDGVEHNGSPA